MGIKARYVSGEELSQIKVIDLHYFVKNFDAVLLSCREGVSLEKPIELSVVKNSIYPINLVSDAYIKANSEEEFLSKFRRVVEKIITDEKYNLKRVIDKITTENNKTISLYKIKNFIREKVTDEKFSVEDTLNTLKLRVEKLESFLSSEPVFNINYEQVEDLYVIPDNVDKIAEGIVLFETGYDVHSSEIFIKEVKFNGFSERKALNEKNVSYAYISEKNEEDVVSEDISQNVLKFNLYAQDGSVNIYIEYDEVLKEFLIKDTNAHSSWFFDIDETKEYQLEKLEKMKEKIYLDYASIVNK